MGAHHKTPESRVFKKKQVYRIWDNEGIDFSTTLIKERVKEVSRATLVRWKREYKEERGIK
jgi:hypothetical protein